MELKNHRMSKIFFFISVGLIVYMPLHVFISTWISTYTGGLVAWSVAKDVLTVAALILSVWVFFKEKLYKVTVFRNIFIIAVAYASLHISFLTVTSPRYDTGSVLNATLFNGRVVAYLFIGMITGYLNRKRLSQELLIKVILGIALVTAVFGILQYFLPSDFMTHFGYSLDRGVRPAFFIDDKPDFPRIMSTFQDPNSFGAYLILPIVISFGLLKQKKLMFTLKKLLVMIVVLSTALILTFSRGALIAVIISVVAYGLNWFRKKHYIRSKKEIAIAVFFTFIVATTVFFTLGRNSYVFKNVILHSDEQTILEDPNELRIRLQREALGEIVETPQGYGPGTAGLVAISNPNGGILTENYFLQILYEVGIFGFLLFTTLVGYVYTLIRKSEYRKTVLSRSLIASFWGYMFVSLLIHLWSNEAVALQWWLLAGVVLGISMYDIQPKRP